MVLPSRDTEPILTRPVTTPIQYSKWSPRRQTNPLALNVFSTIPARAISISLVQLARYAAMRLK
jgi:hypothetical protein